MLRQSRSASLRAWRIFGCQAGIARAQHAVDAAHRARRRQFAPRRVVGMQDAPGQVDQQQAMVDLVEHPGQHAGLQGVGRAAQ